MSAVIEQRNLTRAELDYLIGDVRAPLEIAAAVDALGLGITYYLRRDPVHGHVYGIDVEYSSLPAEIISQLPPLESLTTSIL